jgi:hypothetical protein
MVLVFINGAMGEFTKANFKTDDESQNMKKLLEPPSPFRKK